MADRTVKVDLKGDVNQYATAVDRAARATDKLADKVDAFGKKRATATLRADTSEAQRRLDTLNADLAKVDKRNVSPTVELNAARARMEARTIERDLIALGSMRPSPDVDAQIGLAEAKLRKITDDLNRVDGKRAVAQVDVRTDPSSRRLSTLVSGIGLIAPAAISAGTIAAGALGGLTPILSATAIGAGTAALAFSGFGDAVKAVREAQLNPTTENLKKADEALRSFGQSGKDLARQVASLGDEMSKLKRTAQDNMFPGLSAGLASAQKALPAINGLVGVTAKALGELGRQGGEALGSPFWQDWFNYMSTIAGPILQDLGSMLGNLVKGWAGLSKAFGPLALEISGGLADMAKSFADWASTLDTNDGFQRFVQYVRDNGPTLLDLIGQVGRLIGNIATAAMPVGAVVLPILRDLVSILADIAASPAGPAILSITTALFGMNLALKAVNAVRMSALATALLGVSGNARNASTAVSGLGTAAGGAAGKAGLLRGAMTGIGALAVAGLAGFVAYQGQIDDTSRALLQGGAAAETARAELLSHGDAAKYGGVALFNYSDALTEAERKARDAYNAMTPLERAQVDNTRAQNDLNLAIQRFGPGSQQAIDASRRFGEAQANLSVQTQLANKVGRDYGNTLGQLAAQAGPVGAAAQRIAAGMRATELSAIGARFGVNAAGQAIATLPGGKTVVINADANSARFQIQQVAGNLSGLPKNTPVTVKALTEEAQARLRGIGLEVRQLPNGSFQVIARTEQSRQAIHDLGILAEGDRFFELSARTAQGRITVQDLQRVAGTPQSFDVNAANKAGPTIAEAHRHANLGQQFMLGVNASPANGTIGGTQGFARTPQTMPHLADPSAARGDIRDTQSLAVQRQTFPHLANTSGAQGAVRGVHGQARETQTFRSEADTGGASSALSTLYNSWMGRAIRWVVNVVGGNAGGGPIAAYADGGPLGDQYQPRVLHAASGAHVRKTPTGAGRTGRLVGPGSGTSDSIPLMGSSGEWVVRKRIVAQQGAGAMAMLNAGLADIVRKGSDAQPFRVAVPAGVHSGGSHTVTHGDTNINVEVHNPRAERSSDDIQRTMRKMASQGMFADG